MTRCHGVMCVCFRRLSSQTMIGHRSGVKCFSSRTLINLYSLPNVLGLVDGVECLAGTSVDQYLPGARGSQLLSWFSSDGTNNADICHAGAKLPIRLTDMRCTTGTPKWKCGCGSWRYSQVSFIPYVNRSSFTFPDHTDQ